MKKRLYALILAVALVLSLLPAAVFAGENPAIGLVVTADGSADINALKAGDTVTAKVTLPAGDYSSVQLKLGFDNTRFKINNAKAIKKNFVPAASEDDEQSGWNNVTNSAFGTSNTNGYFGIAAVGNRYDDASGALVPDNITIENPLTCFTVQFTVLDTAADGEAQFELLHATAEDFSVNEKVAGTEQAKEIVIPEPVKATVGSASTTPITPTCNENPTATVTVGDPVANADITGGVMKDGETTVPGVFVWSGDVTSYGAVGTKQLTAVFVPDDSTTYTSVEVAVNVTVQEAQSSGTSAIELTVTADGSADIDALKAGDTVTASVTLPAGDYSSVQLKLGFDNTRFKINNAKAIKKNFVPAASEDDEQSGWNNVTNSTFAVSNNNGYFGIAAVGNRYDDASGALVPDNITIENPLTCFTVQFTVLDTAAEGTADFAILHATAEDFSVNEKVAGTEQAKAVTIPDSVTATIGSGSTTPITPTCNENPTATVTEGDPVANADITGGVMKDGETTVPGTFAWKDDVTSYGAVGTKQLTAIFTPTDTTTYASVEVAVNVTVQEAQSSETSAIELTVTADGSADIDALKAGDTVTASVTLPAGDYSSVQLKLGFDNTRFKINNAKAIKKNFVPAASEDDEISGWNNVTNSTFAVSNNNGYFGIAAVGNRYDDASGALVPDNITIENPLTCFTVQFTVLDTAAEGTADFAILHATAEDFSVNEKVAGTEQAKAVTIPDSVTATIAGAPTLITPTCNENPTATVTVGDTVSDSDITGGVMKDGETTVPGTFAWKDDVTSYGAVGTKQLTAIFTPTDTTTYASVEVAVNVTVSAPPHTHSAGEPVQENVNPASCTVDGSYDEVTYCTICGAEMSRTPRTIMAPGHSISPVTEVPATCTTDGTAAHYKCSVCDKLFSDANGEKEVTAASLVIPAAHTLSPVAEVPATCTTDGTAAHYKCSVCNKLFSDAEGKNEVTAADLVIPAAHTLSPVAKVAATCTTNGTAAHYKCTVCNKLFSDANGTTEVTAADLVIPAAHTLSPVAEVPATCTTNGTAAHYKCSVCEKLFSDAEGKNEVTAADLVIPAAHTITSVAEVPAGCETTGTAAHYKCTVCNKLFSDANGTTEVTAESLVIKALDHLWNAGVETTPATCTEPGVKTFTCQRDSSHHKTEPISAKGHTMTQIAATQPSCTTAGNIAHYKCTTCQKLYADANGTQELTAQAVIDPATGHDLSYSANGAVITEHCSRNDHDETATISATDAEYTGSQLKTASVAYSTDWLGGELTIAYLNNVEPGTATASITKSGVTASVEFTITKTAKTPTLNVQASYTRTYDGTPVAISELAQPTATYNGKTVAGTFAWAEGTEVTNVADSGTKTIVFTPDDPTSYTSANATVNVTIEKATPAGKPKFTPITSAGKTLADANLTTEGATFTVEGTVAWTAGDATIVSANAAYEWVFTPDNENYNTLKGTAVVYSEHGSYSYFVDPFRYLWNEVQDPRSNGGFYDVNNSDYFRDAVKWAAENGITTGTSAHYFTPDGACTRAQTVTFLWRSVGSPRATGSYNPFVDVRPSDYFYDAVLWATEQGITKGTSATTFSPAMLCTRAHVVTFLYRLAGEPSIGKATFADVSERHFASEAIAWAAANNITTGTSATTFSPEVTCTRAQIVTFLYRYFNK